MQDRSEHITRRYAFASKNSSSSRRCNLAAVQSEAERGGKNGKFNEQHIRLYLAWHVTQYRNVRELKVCKYRLIGEACTRAIWARSIRRRPWRRHRLPYRTEKLAVASCAGRAEDADEKRRLKLLLGSSRRCFARRERWTRRR